MEVRFQCCFPVAECCIAAFHAVALFSLVSIIAKCATSSRVSRGLRTGTCRSLNVYLMHSSYLCNCLSFLVACARPITCAGHAF